MTEKTNKKTTTKPDSWRKLSGCQDVLADVMEDLAYMEIERDRLKEENDELLQAVKEAREVIEALRGREAG